MTPEKLCVFCKHWEFNGGSPGYSEMTPGMNASMDCRKRKWADEKRRRWVGGFDITDCMSEEDFRRLILKARTCPSYEPDNGAV